MQHEQKIATLNEKFVAEHEKALRLRSELDESHRSSNLLYNELLTNKTELKQIVEQCKQLREQTNATQPNVESQQQQQLVEDVRAALAVAETAAETARRSYEATEKRADAARDESNRLQSELSSEVCFLF